MSDPGYTELSGFSYTLYNDGIETLEVWERGEDGEMRLRDAQVAQYAVVPLPPGFEFCDVNWGSHGCHRERGHPADQPCECDCCECPDHPHHPEEDEWMCVAKPPYYGPETRFYGKDVAARGLPGLD